MMNENYVEYLLERQHRKMRLLTGEYRNVRTDNVIGKCHNLTHPGIVTKKLLTEHECLNKECPFLEKFSDHPFWVQYEKEQEEKNKRKAEKKKNADKKKDITKKCNNIKIQVEYIADKYDMTIKVVDVKHISRNNYKVFYVSDKKKNDWNTYGPIISVLREIYNYRLEFTHIKDFDGKYVTIEEFEKKEKFI